MAKRNKILIGTLCAAVLALVIALCFVGNTFARFTLSETETASVSIAKWSVTLDENLTESSDTGTAELSGESLRPSADIFDSASTDLPRTKDCFAMVGTLTNDGEVSAEVTATYGGSVTPNYSSEYTEANTVSDEFSVANDETVYANDTGRTASDYVSELDDHFKVTVYYSTDANLTAATNKKGDTLVEAVDDTEAVVAEDDAHLFGDEDLILAGSEDTSETYPSSVYIYFDVQWISDIANTDEDTSEEMPYINGDGFDTWAGTVITSFAFSVTINAYQVSD